MPHPDVKQLYLNTLLEIYNRPSSVNLLIQKSSELEKLSLDRLFVKRRLQVHHERYHPSLPPSIISISQALYHHHHLLMIGDAGSGKSTLLNWLAIVFAKEKHPEHFGVHQSFLPIVIKLREFVPYLSSQQLHISEFLILEKEIPSFIGSHVRLSMFSKWLGELLPLYPCLILWDGLDEIAQGEQRQRFLDAMYLFTQRHFNIRCVLTTRPYGLEGLKIPIEFKEVTLQPFNQEEIVTFLHTWYKAFYPSQHADQLINMIQSNPRIEALASNPLLCTLMGLVHQERGQLPHRRTQLYQEVCETLIARWDECLQIRHSGAVGQLSSPTKLKLLERIAYGFQEKESQVILTESKVTQLLAQGLTTLQSKGEELQRSPEEEAQNFITAIWGHRGLLQGKGERNFEFIHRNFQEYLAACYLASQEDSQCIDEIMTHLHEGWWREVHLLAIGCLGKDAKGAQQIAQLVHYIWKVYRPPYRFLLPNHYRLNLGKYFPSWQWKERIVWHLLREFSFIVQGFAECDPEGRNTQLTDQLVEFSIKRVKEWSNDIESYREPLELIINLVKDSLPKTMLVPIAETLLPALKHKNWQVRYWVAKNLGKLGIHHESIVSVLLRALYDERSEVRNAVVGSLEKLGVTKDQMVAVLLTPLQNGDAYMKVRAAGNLVKLGVVNDEVMSILFTALRDERSYVRICSAEGLTFLETVTSTVTSSLLDALKDEHWYVRALATKILGQLEIKTPEAVTALLLALKDKNKEVRSCAAKSLGQLKVIDKTVIFSLLKALRDRDKRVRSRVAKSLGQLKVVEEPVISELLYALRDKDSEVRGQAARSLGRLGLAREGIASALFRALRDKDIKVRSQAAKSLGQLGVVKEEVVRVLVSALQEKHQLGSSDGNALKKLQEDGIKKFTSSSTGQVPKKMLSTLLKALQDEEVSVRNQAAKNLVILPLTERQQKKVLIKLNQFLHDDRLRNDALALIKKLLEGRQLPGYVWQPLKIQIKEKERRERRLRKMVWGLLIVILFGAILVLSKDLWENSSIYSEWLIWVYGLHAGAR